MRIPHYAVLAGLVGALALGGVAAPVTAHAEEAVPAAADAAPAATEGDGTTDDFAPESAGVSVPTDYDKADFYEAAPLASALVTARSARAGVVGATDEMKYFTLYESGQNYDQGFSRWDGYHAMGYYQFDRRYSLVALMRYCYNYDPVTFAMFKPLIDRGAELSNASTVIFDTATGRLTEIGQLAEDAWHAAYAADPATFAALQDSYAISNYYMPTENWLRSALGIDISGRADCVKGLVWSISNLFGTGGVKTYLRAANLSNDMSDRAFVNAIVDSLPASLAAYNSNTQYHQSWINRYEKERATCLAYIAEDEAQASQPGTDEPAGDAGTGDNQGTGDVETPGDGSTDVPAGDQGDGSHDEGGSADGDASGDSSAPAGDEGSDDTPGDASGDASDGTGSADDPAADGAVDNDSDDAADSDDNVTPAPIQPAPPASNNAAGNTTSPDGGAQTDGSSSNDATSGTGLDDGTASNSATGNGEDSASKTDNAPKTEQPSDNGGKTSTSTNANASTSANASTKANADAKRLPKTGDAAGLMAMVAAGTAMLGGASLLAAKRFSGSADKDASDN